jgi:hypothetical protein
MDLSLQKKCDKEGRAAFNKENRHEQPLAKAEAATAIAGRSMRSSGHPTIDCERR